MVQERVEIIITETGARVVKRSITEIGTSAKGSADSVAFLQQALITLGGANLIQRLVGVADAFTNMQNRIRLVTNNVEELNAVTEELLGISNRTRTSIETNAELFNRFALSTRELGLSQGRVLRIIESVNKATLISGASAKEANNGLIQLSQGLASGALRGDELRSVLEQLPAVADLIASQLGVTRGQLRAIGADFRITSEVLVDAFENAADTLDERFGKVVPTVEQSFVVLGNSIKVALGRFNEGNGITRRFSTALLEFAQDVDLVGRVALSGVLAGGIIAVTVALNLLTTAILRNPFSALFVAVTAAASTLTVFSDQIIALDDGLTTLENVGVAAFNAISTSLSNMLFVLSGFAPELRNNQVTFEVFVRAVAKGLDLIVGFFEGIGNSITSFIKGTAGFVITVLNGVLGFINTIIGSVVSFTKTVGQTFSIVFKGVVVAAKNVSAAISEAFKGSFDSAEQLLSNAVDSLTTTTDVAVDSFGARLEKNFEANNNTLNLLVNPYENFGENIGEAFLRGLDRTNIQDGVAEVFKEANDLALQQEKDRILAIPEQKPPVDLFAAGIASPDAPTGLGQGAFDQVLKDLQQEADLLLLNNDAREIQIKLLKVEEDLRKQGVTISESERAQIQDKLELIQALELQNDVLQEIVGPQEEYNKKVEALNQLLATGRINTEQFGNALRDLKIDLLDTQTDFASGFERGLEKVNKGFEDFATGAEELVTNAFQNMEDVFVQFATTGKLSFDDLITGIIADLARLASQQLLKDLLGGLTGGTGGTDLAGFLAGFFGGAAATGATNMNPNKAYLVGEKGPELFVPPSAGGIVPNNQLAAVAAPAAAPQITILNVSDKDEVAQIMDSPQGEEVILNILRRNPTAVRQAIG